MAVIAATTSARMPERRVSPPSSGGGGREATSKSEVVAEAGEAIRSLLMAGRITLVPNAQGDAMVGTVHFKAPALRPSVSVYLGVFHRAQDCERLNFFPRDVKKSLLKTEHCSG